MTDIPSYENLRPQQRKILENEFFREKLVQERLQNVLDDQYYGKIREDKQLAFSLVADELRKHGYTAEDVDDSDNNPELRKIVWNAVDKYWHYFEKLPVSILCDLFEIDPKELDRLAKKGVSND
jgi:hypothetical protein